MIQLLTGAHFKAMMTNAAAAIDNNKIEINELNVFPVPDGDTGTNMSLTMLSASRALSDKSPETISKAADITASALLLGARGNSGVILSLLFRGISKRMKDVVEADSVTFALGLRDGVEAAYNAVMKPTEGTILTVARLAADAAITASETETDIEIVLERALGAAWIALENTINQNPVLKKAGVIDSGGKGYVYILDAMLRALKGEVIEQIEDSGAEVRVSADFSEFDTGDITFAYCTEFIIIRENSNNPINLRAFLSDIGDSLVLVDDDDIIKVHVHTNEPGVAITEALTYGSLMTVKIENMKEQHTEKVVTGAPAAEASTANGAVEEPATAEIEKRYGSVAVCSGDGLEAVFTDLGADKLITGGQTMNPSTEDILAAVNATPAEIVFVYPNNKNIIMAAEQVAPLCSKQVVVVPTRSIPQGVSAMLAFDPEAEPDENVATIKDAIAAVRTVLVTHAARDSSFDGFDISEGEYLALINDALLTSSADFAEVIDAICAKLAENPTEFVTVFSGEDATVDEFDALITKLNGLSGAEITSLEGGQPVYRFMISAE